MALTLAVGPHPLLEIGAFSTQFAQPLAELSTPDVLLSQLDPSARRPFEPQTISDDDRTAVRNLLRHGGFKPSGRSKPASEYLQAAYAEGRFPRINAPVDACNIASLFSGLPISLIDLDKVSGSLSVATCPMGTTYVFNPSGQVIDAGGLLAVFDGEGPTGTPVKDAQRTKTHDGTTRTLAVIWGTSALPGRTRAATAWYRELVAMIPGATSEDVVVRSDR
jgi:DNA/RNA-binding domain of Phe-tRNA-synthetase-like protein